MYCDFSDIPATSWDSAILRHRRRGSRVRGARNLSLDIELTFEEAAFEHYQDQVHATIHVRNAMAVELRRFPGPTTCPTCNGYGQVRFQQGFFAITRTCSQCHGTGHLSERCMDVMEKAA